MFGGDRHDHGYQQMRGQDVKLTLEIEFMEAVSGVTKAIQYKRNEVCGTCKGSRMQPGTGPS